MSISNTVGATVRPVATDMPVPPMLTTPVLLYGHPPWRPGDPCSWYCQRALMAGFQQWPTDWLQGTGVGMSARADRAPALWAGPADRNGNSSPSDNDARTTTRDTRAFIFASPTQSSIQIRSRGSAQPLR